jgi:phage-related protein
MLLGLRYFCQGQREPVADYIEELETKDVEAIAKIEQRILALAAEGPRSPVLDTRHLGEGLWELKVRTRMSGHRIFYCIEEGTIWLLHAIAKKSAKTPLDALGVARRRMKEAKGL